MRIVFFTVFLLQTFLGFAQCFKSGNFEDGPEFNFEGTTLLTIPENGNSILSFDESFSTTSGPDLHVFLSNSEIVSTPNGILETPETLDLGLLKNHIGAQSYEIAPEVSVADYSYVVIHCKAYNHYWGTATLSPFYGENCSILSVQDFTENQIKVYPTIVDKATLTVEIPFGVNASCQIFSLTGKNAQNLVALNQSKNELNLASIKSGFYIVQINIEGKTFQNKIFIK